MNDKINKIKQALILKIENGWLLQINQDKTYYAATIEGVARLLENLNIAVDEEELDKS
jgi:hypothetical protein